MQNYSCDIAMSQYARISINITIYYEIKIKYPKYPGKNESSKVNHNFFADIIFMIVCKNSVCKKCSKYY